MRQASRTLTDSTDPDPGAAAVENADVAALEAEAAAARRRAWRWSAVGALVVVGLVALSVGRMGPRGLAFAPFFAVAFGAPCCVPPWHRYHLARKRVRAARRGLKNAER